MTEVRMYKIGYIYGDGGALNIRNFFTVMKHHQHNLTPYIRSRNNFLLDFTLLHVSDPHYWNISVL